MKIQFASRILDLSQPSVMGILNVTPDSFFDGGRYFAAEKGVSAAIAHARSMVDAGASFIDVGGESTRPGAAPVSIQEEMDRVLPVVEGLSAEVDAVVSIDTSSPEVIIEGARLGAGLINDVRALQQPGALKAAADTKLPVCLMHMKGQPDTMQQSPSYNDVIAEVGDFFRERVAACEAAGILRNRIILDPGFGFGKTDEHNLALLDDLADFKVFKVPVLAGLSRKSLIGRLLNRDVDQRLPGSLGLALYALQNGASILRVHDVAETVDIVKLYQAMQAIPPNFKPQW